MHPITPLSPTSAVSETESVRIKDAVNQAPLSPEGMQCNAPADPYAGVGAVPQAGAVDCCMRNRVQRVLSDLAAGRTVADEEIRRHIEDLRFLLETAHDRFLASGLPRQESPDYAQAQEFRRLRDEALHMLSPEFKRARHLEVLRRADAEPGGVSA